MKFKTFVAALPLFISAQAFAYPTNIRCHDTGGGYLTRTAEITQNADGSVSVRLELFSELEDMKDNTGLILGNHLVKRLDTVFPKGACRFETSSLPTIPFLYCSSGIFKIPAQLLLVDGTTKTVQLRDNKTVSNYLNTKETMSGVQRTVTFESSLGESSYDKNDLGFVVSDGPRSSCTAR